MATIIVDVDGGKQFYTYNTDTIPRQGESVLLPSNSKHTVEYVVHNLEADSVVLHVSAGVQKGFVTPSTEEERDPYPLYKRLGE
jgi:hypothetical protein